MMKIYVDKMMIVRMYVKEIFKTLSLTLVNALICEHSGTRTSVHISRCSPFRGLFLM